MVRNHWCQHPVLLYKTRLAHYFMFILANWECNKNFLRGELIMCKRVMARRKTFGLNTNMRELGLYPLLRPQRPCLPRFVPGHRAASQQLRSRSNRAR